MSFDPWTDGDPQPGDFDIDLATIDAQHVEHSDGDPTATLRILVSVEGEDARRLGANCRGAPQDPVELAARASIGSRLGGAARPP